MNVPTAVPALDIYTAKVMTLVSVLVVTFVSLSSWRINKRIAGMRAFTLGLLSISLGAVVGLARIVISGNVALVACNVFMLGGMVSIVQGIRLFRGLAPLTRTTVSAFTVIVSAFYGWWMIAQSNFGMRVGVVSAAFTFLLIDAAVSMIRGVPKRDRAIYWSTGFAFAFAAAYQAARTIGALSGSYGAGLLSPVPIELASTICANAAYIGCAFGMSIASNAKLRSEIEKMALLDPLTNLHNRRSFGERLQDAEQRALLTGRKLGLIYLDLDEFKLINDMLGHDVGDDFLRNISTVMVRMLRAGDCLGRIGGDEFVVLIEDVQNRSEIAGLGARLKEAIEREPVPCGVAASVRVSCGVAIFPDDGCSARDAMRKADSDMYHSKERNRKAGKMTSLDFASTSEPIQRPHIENTTAQTNVGITADVSFRRRKSDQITKTAETPIPTSHCADPDRAVGIALILSASGRSRLPQQIHSSAKPLLEFSRYPRERDPIGVSIGDRLSQLFRHHCIQRGKYAPVRGGLAE